MKIILDKVGRRYNREWIFRDLSHTFENNSSTVILGGNGSGKSTLAQIIMNHITPSEGNITYEINTNIPSEKIYQHIAIASPYIEIFEDFTLQEIINFQAKLKPFHNQISTQEIMDKIQLNTKEKAIKYFSSGMKQRVKLGLAIMSNANLLILDEPTSNLDHMSIDWYQKIVDEYKKDRTIIVCSNKQEHEYHFCKENLNVESFKN